MSPFTATRPDISYAVGRLSSFLDGFRLEHWEAAVRVLRYLKGTRSFALTLGGKNSLAISGYSDSDYANCIDTSRSIGGYCFVFDSGMISWSSKKQTTVADSSCYAEYIALHSASYEVVFLRQLLEGLRFLLSGPTQLLCDNDAASRLSEDHVWHSHSKHIRVKYHYARELVLNGDVSISRVGSKDNTADIFTKPLPCADFQRLRYYLGVRALDAASHARGGVFPVILFRRSVFSQSVFSRFLIIDLFSSTRVYPYHHTIPISYFTISTSLLFGFITFEL